jgi:hypothetical protein
VTAGPNSQNGQPRTRFDRHVVSSVSPVCSARRYYRRFRRASRLQGRPHQRAPMLRRGEARVQKPMAPLRKAFLYMVGPTVRTRLLPAESRTNFRLNEGGGRSG